MILHKAILEQLCGDISNVLPNANTKEKIYIPKTRLEFGEHVGECIIIKKALNGLYPSRERFHSHLTDTLHLFGFKHTCFDNDA